MEIGVHEKGPCCSVETFLGKENKTRSASQQQLGSENTLATIETDHILMALEQWANKTNSANLNDHIHRISKLPKSLTTTMPTFDAEAEKFELLEELFQTSLKTHNQLTEDNRINYFHSLMKGNALQTFKNFDGNLEATDLFGNFQSVIL